MSLSHKNVAGIFTTGGSDTYACGFVSRTIWFGEKGVIVAGFDLFPQTLGYIKSGDTTFTTDQQAYLQGFLPVQQIKCTKLSNCLVGPADTNTSEAYVTKDNVDHYLTKKPVRGKRSSRTSLRLLAKPGMPRWLPGSAIHGPQWKRSKPRRSSLRNLTHRLRSGRQRAGPALTTPRLDLREGAGHPVPLSGGQHRCRCDHSRHLTSSSAAMASSSLLNS